MWITLNHKASYIPMCSAAYIWYELPVNSTTSFAQGESDWLYPDTVSGYDSHNGSYSLRSTNQNNMC